MSKLKQLADLGQSIWYDYIHRKMIESGELKQLVDDGLRGMTSNPAIFKGSIAGSDLYDDNIKELVQAGKSTNEIYDELAIRDIKDACDALRPVFDANDGHDGFVSLEVSPKLAHDTEGTIKDAKRYFAAVDRPNLMIKIPGAQEGLPAITETIGNGINVNVTLIFSVENYKQVAEAYIAGLEKLDAAGGDVSKIASVASFFVSRVDTAVDKALEEVGNKELQGKIAVANSKIAYKDSKEIFSGPRWEKLAAKGAKPQRLLWASTGTKNPDYSDVLYVDELIGANTVNTMPPATLKAFVDHGKLEPTLEQNVEEAEKQIADLASAGVNLESITDQLQIDGIDLFVQAFDALLESIDKKKSRL